MSVDEKTLSRIERLLSLATSDNEHESAVAMQKARELLAKHGLELSDVQVRENRGPEDIQSDVYVLEDDDGWVFTLASIVSTHFGCTAVKFRGVRDATQLRVFGPPTFHQAAYKATLSLYAQINRLASKAWKDMPPAAKAYLKRKSFARGFKRGAVDRLAFNLATLRREETQETTAIILATNAQSNAAAESYFKNLRTVSPKDPTNSLARSLGWQAGEHLTVTSGELED